MKKFYPQVITVLVLVLVLLIAVVEQPPPVQGAGTLAYRGAISDAMPLYDTFVWTGTFAGASDTFTVPTTFTVDEFNWHYTAASGLAYTAPIKLASISGTTYKLTGDNAKTYKVILKDYVDH